MNNGSDKNFTMTNSTQTNNISISVKELKSGYDLPVYGLDSGQFYAIHIVAIACIFTSLGCAITVIVFSFVSNKSLSFFRWTKSERFAVYLAICDGLFNLCHSMDHLQIVITRNHVYPVELCRFYGFMLAEFVSAQNILVFIIAINAFLLIYFQKNLEFGQNDWRLLLCTFGIPFVAAVCAAAFGFFGPSGAFCLFDGVNGYLANLFFTTIPLFVVFILNSFLYLLTWRKINAESKRLKDCLGKETKTVSAAHSAAKTMSLFVAVFFIQWWALAAFAVWQLNATHVPEAMFQVTIFFTNIGGVLNGIVYVFIRRRRRTSGNRRQKYETTAMTNVATIEQEQKTKGQTD
ncbi:hypothetical protein FSP39_021221 [Pinctada imbricata]|uniref:G-protein coupled receptors family 1 profile domain-containing protein n=1 Tax=Pinctada imbricata TaxID=66713 RepID=A0AA89BTG8_PINIB|nr:hypothetical protein FSP39_021221 [Pinctada imbricata]